MTDPVPSKERDNGLCYEHEYPRGGMSTTVWKKSSCPFCQVESLTRDCNDKDIAIAELRRELAESNQMLESEWFNRVTYKQQWRAAQEQLAKPAHEREPPHCSTCACGLALPPGDVT